MNRPLTRKEWLASLDKAIKEFDWDAAFEEPLKEKYQYGTPLLDAMTKDYVPSHRPWVGLTDEEQQAVHDAWIQKDDGWGSFYALIEAKLKEKNT